MVTQKLITMYTTYQQKDSEGRSINYKKCRKVCLKLHSSSLTAAGFNLFFCAVHIWIIFQHSWVKLILSFSSLYPSSVLSLLLPQSEKYLFVECFRTNRCLEENDVAVNLHSKANNNTANTNGGLQVKAESISSITMKTTASLCFTSIFSGQSKILWITFIWAIY